MNLLKGVFVAVAMAVAAVAEPALPGQNQYLPPPPGYSYPTPKIPFTTPAYKPPTPPPTYRPSQPPPTYGPPTPPPYGPPTPPPTLPPTRPPPVYPRPTPPYPPPTGPTYGPPGDHHHHDHVHEPGMPFDFAYAVKDDLHGADYAHRANSNGDVVQGEYRNLLPDGRIQTVRYTADWATGFHAEVSYEGEPRYPAPAPGPAYGAPQQQQQPPNQQPGY